MDEESPVKLVVYSVGHSVHAISKFLKLLTDHSIRIVFDVRTKPWSRYNPPFNKPDLQRAITEAGLLYVHRPDLGGLQYWNADGSIGWDRVDANPQFSENLAEIMDAAKDIRVAMMCSEGNPADCHREHIIAVRLRQHGYEVAHILSDGTIGDACGKKKGPAKIAAKKEGSPQSGLF